MMNAKQQISRFTDWSAKTVKITRTPRAYTIFERSDRWVVVQDLDGEIVEDFPTQKAAQDWVASQAK